MTFDSFDLHPELLRGVADLGWSTPTPIQTDAIPQALAGRDVLACAATGSGKTAAFLLPVLHRLLDRPRGTTRVLVLTPTRELAAQIAESLEALARHTPLTGAAVFGGVAMGPQERAFRDGVDILVATPGRLLDHFQNDYARLDNLEVLILDEADRMLDMGFLPDVRRVLAQLPEQRQNLLFSATLPTPIVELVREMLREPVSIGVERKATTVDGVDQAIFPVREELKPWLLIDLLNHEKIPGALVFTRTKHRANRLADLLARNGVACDRIHGNRSQAQRTEALARFKDGRLRVLVATDIAARGIDVEALSHVVNFDVPNVPEDYIHRVGRTARAGLTGEAFTLAAPEESPELAAIERAVGLSLPQRTLEGFDYDAEPPERFEVPLGERIATLRARRAEERARAREKAERKAQRETEERARRGGEKDRRRPDRAAAGPRDENRQPQAPREARETGRNQVEPGNQLHPRPGQAAAGRPGKPFGKPGKRPGGGGQGGQGGGQQRPGRHRHVEARPPEPKHPDLTERPTEERAAKIATTFQPGRLRRF
ncbi:MAG TPA: DEAD/DEAH box helicase [Thermoanaerobaculia bacterium]|nr:DEAD/DEAH box helicase [Thermoanaerobaculia bacterium]